MIEFFEELDKLTAGERRTPHKQKLQQELFYNTVESVLAGDESVLQVTKTTAEQLLQAYSAAGFIDDRDFIVFPAGTIFTWVKSIEPDRFDIYRVQGTTKCFIAVRPTETVELFGEVAYRE